MTEMLSAAALAHAVRAGRLTPADIAERCAETIRAQEPQVRAFATLDLDGMLARSREAGLAERPLAGLPIGIKDVLDTAALPTERGSPLYAGYLPATDAAVVRMALRAGAVMAGKMATTEFAFMKPAATRNPRRHAHTPGGSSAGSAAAVAAGMLPLALGTQTAGSVIRPASFCGVTGYKPSFKLIPVLGLKVFAWSLDTIGLFGAHVGDVAFAAAAMTGRDLQPDEESEAPHFALAKTARADQASPDAHAALEAAAEAARKAGARVTEIELPPEIEASDEAQGVIQSYEAALAFADEWDRHREQLSDMLAAYLADGMTIAPETYDAARRTARRGRHALADLFAGYDALLTFSAPGEAPEGHASTGSPMFNRLWTLSGAPCVNVAGLTGASGLPMGVQVVGRFGRDKATLGAARFLERAIAAA
ncbi:amidase [Ancylobacter sp. MQZ15Z-1]|uniref:Amidase n=1 Tax=Ancylobacter mangrovi TaxID=2972472 RepID=A0A9X2PB61_9HYPH|nr:amidase [Ancylobacter mangrovi]MCS0493681.1 amidase [Ancylobacter mangrovi]